MNDSTENLEESIKLLQEERKRSDGSLVSLGPDSIGYDDYLYDSKPSGILTEEIEEEPKYAVPTYSAPKNVYDSHIMAGDNNDPFKETRRKTIAEREDSYRQKGRASRAYLSPERADMFSDKTPAADQRKPADAILEARLEREEAALKRQLEQKKRKRPKGKRKTNCQIRKREK
jgi:hypothetical protein